MLTCTNCHKKGLFRKPVRWIKIDNLLRREMTCRCGHKQLEEAPQEIKIPPRILYIDIETSKVEFKVRQFDRQVRSGWLDWHDITKPFCIICWSAAWVTDRAPRVMSGALTACETKHRQDKRHLKILWDLLDNADYVVGHNVKGFDLGKIEARFILNDMLAPEEYKVRDTLTMAKSRFKHESNALDYWMQQFNDLRKDKMRGEDWDRVDAGDQRAINKMVHYNRGDVRAGISLLKRFVVYVESGSNKKVFP
jgi:hypothetical protein